MPAKWPSWVDFSQSAFGVKTGDNGRCAGKIVWQQSPIANLARAVEFKRAKDHPANCSDNSGDAKALRITQPRVSLVTALFLKEPVVTLSNPGFSGLRSLVRAQGQRETA
jgi:hypothetical protein